MIRAAIALLIVTGSLALSGCAVTEEIKTSLFDTTKVNLTDNTYAAADMLAQQLKSRITTTTPIHIGVLTDVRTPNETTAFGQQVATHLGSRLVQLGFSVQSVPIPPTLAGANGAPGLPGAVLAEPLPLNPTGGAPKPVQRGMTPASPKGACLLTGTYTRMKHDLQVNLKVMQAPDQKVIAAFDYGLPMTRDIREISMSAEDRKKHESELFSEFRLGE